MKIPQWAKTALSFVIVGGLIVLAFVSGPKHVLTFSHELAIGSAQIKVAIADSDAARSQGLSDTKPLAANEGMLFVFDEPGVHSFWMKDMSYSLDIIWLDAEKKVVEIKSNFTPESYPEIFTPKAQAAFVLEVQAGFAEANEVIVGTQATF